MWKISAPNLLLLVLFLLLLLLLVLLLLLLLFRILAFIVKGNDEIQPFYLPEAANSFRQ